jgi:hypothetical protein
MTIRWKMAPKETGLRRVLANPRLHWLQDNGKRFACVSPSDRSGSSWYWVAGWDSDVPHKNTWQTPAKTVEEAKTEAMKYVKANLTPNS